MSVQTNVSAQRRPRVLVPACHRDVDGVPTACVGQKYLDAVVLAGAQPWVMPGCAEEDLSDVLAMVDGVMLTGSPSNVHAAHYGQSVLDESLPLDARRDAWVLPMISRAMAEGLPLLGICRGLQEINVALGGSLHQAVQELPGHLDHRAPDDLADAQAYSPVHPVRLEEGGLLRQILGSESIEVNSLHGQGVARLAAGLRAEAHAPDGLIEAFSAVDAPAFTLAVQWHPEWRAADSPVSRQIFAAFGDACRQRMQQRGLQQHSTQQHPAG